MSDSVSKKPDVVAPWTKNQEPTLEEVLRDPIVQLRMTSSGTTPDAVRQVCEQAAAKLAA